MSGFIGPALPPHLRRTSSEEGDTENSGANSRQPAGLRRKSSSASSRADLEDVLVLTTDISDELFHDEVDEDAYGPVLPPGFKKTSNSQSEPSQKVERSLSPNMDVTDSNDGDSDADSVQGRRSIGPVIPSRLKSTVQSVPSATEDEEASPSQGKYIGPSLPPGLLRQQSSDSEEVTEVRLRYIPAQLPQGAAADADDSNNNDDDGGAYLGPALPPGFRIAPNDTAAPDSEEDEDDNDVVGPQLEMNVNSESQRRLEIRARRLRHEMTNKESAADTVQKRESWMLELPPEKAVDLGLGPRQFRTRAREDPGDRSVWTDTPSDRANKKADPKSSEHDKHQLTMLANQERDEAMDKLAEKHGSKRGGQSLLEMHQEKLKKKKKKDKKEGKTEERRPFSRELDLQTNRFDEAQKKSIFKKAQLLNDRFSAGHSKYL